jgi:hypothetical protein
MPGSGKSTLLNLLVGSDVIPQGVRLPTMQLTYGDTPQAVCTLPDGSKTTLPTADAREIAALSPVFVDLHLPLPALGKISVLEIVTPAETNAIHRACQWASKRTDVALWCTAAFDDEEHRIWSTMPDIMKDHAILMLTKADVQAAAGTLADTMAHLQAVARDEFNQTLAISATSAIAARNPDGSVDKDQMRSSGGMALIAAVLKQVEMGKQSAVDMADVLLHQHADVLAAAPVDEVPPAPEAEAEPAPQAEPVAAEVPPVVEAKPAPATATASGLKPATRTAYVHVVTHIAARSRTLLALAQSKGGAAASEVISMTVEEVQWLTDYLYENGEEGDPALDRARDMAFDAADMVQLMQMEKDDGAAIDAVTVLLQVKHELQADLAA